MARPWCCGLRVPGEVQRGRLSSFPLTCSLPIFLTVNSTHPQNAPGYLWLDWFSVPQLDQNSDEADIDDSDKRSASKDLQLAVESIPA